MIDEEFQKYLQIQLTNCFFVVLNIFAVSYLVLHVLYFFLSWIEPHTSHHIGDCTQGYFSIQLSCLGCVFIL